MTPRRDYSCEILALIVLVVLSALSHFWYIMIAIGVGMAISGAGFLLSRLVLRARTEMAAHFPAPGHHRSAGSRADASVEVPRGATPSLPAA